MGRYVYFTRFELNEFSGGGCRRFVQLYQIIRERFPSLEVISSREISAGSLSDEILYGLGLKGSVTGGDYTLWAEGHRDYAYSLTFAARKWARLLKSPAEIELAFVDDPIYFAPLVKRLREIKVPVVAACHNIESLSAQQTMPKGQIALLKKELGLFSECAAVITVSREEDFLLGNVGVNSVFFPYYPVDTVLEKLRAIREKRKSTKKRGLLAIGTVFNAPTRDGMEKLISFWNDRGYELTGEKLIVAGFGTETLKGSGGEGVKVFGSLSDEELGNLLSIIKACICYQEKASGALTRIQEMLLAGVPVVANSRAARTYHNIRGVHEFRTLEQSGEAVRKAEIAGEFPEPEKPDKTALLQFIEELSH